MRKLGHWKSPAVQVLVTLLAFPPLWGVPSYRHISPEDIKVLHDKLAIAADAGPLLSERTLAVARSFTGTPYVKGTLRAGEEKELVVNLRELDCWTFVENSLAIALISGQKDQPEAAFETEVQKLRYMDGRINGYGSRIHYFSGWLIQAEKNGLLTDITKSIGGVPFRKEVYYMSTHAEKYPELRDPKILQQIRWAEARLNQHTWFYIPQNNIEAVEDKIKDGDIIAITSAKSGLDFAHEGFAVRRNGHIYLMHASSLARRVFVSNQTLGNYLREQKGQTGIVVARIRG